MIIHPRFYDPVTADRARCRREQGLHPELPAGLVSFGGYGSNQMLEIAATVARANLGVQFIFLCGPNTSLARRLHKLELPYPHHIQGFSDNVAPFMAMRDFFIGKPGPGSVSEALAMRLPVIVLHSRHTLAQERYNVQWIRQHEVGTAVNSIQELPAAIASILAPARKSTLAERIGTLDNRAVFEIPEVLDHILERDSAPHHPSNWKSPWPSVPPSSPACRPPSL